MSSSKQQPYIPSQSRPNIQDEDFNSLTNAAAASSAASLSSLGQITLRTVKSGSVSVTRAALSSPDRGIHIRTIWCRNKKMLLIANQTLKMKQISSLLSPFLGSVKS